MKNIKYGKEKKKVEEKEKKVSEEVKINKLFPTLLTFSLAFSLFFLLNVNLSLAWYSGYSDWQYRQPITITEQSGNTLTDYQVKLTIDTASLISAGKMNSDCSDIRFTYYDGSTEQEIPYWIESGCNSDNTIVWVKVPEIPANGETTIYMYYGNPNAVSESNPYNTLEAYADAQFMDSISKTGGDTNDIFGSTTYGGENCIYFYEDGGSNSGTWKVGASIDTPNVVEYKFYDDASDGSYYIIVRMSSSNQLGIGVYTSESSSNYVKIKDGFLYESIGVTRTTGWHLVKIVSKNATYHKIYFDENYIQTDTQEVSSPTLFISLYHNYPGYYYISYIKAYKYTDPEPTYSIGTEELPNQPPQITITTPTNTTYFTTNILANFTITDAETSTFPVKAYLDNQLIYDNSNYQNYTEITLNLTPYITQDKSYNFTVWANDTDGTAPQISTQTVIFTVKDFNLEELDWEQNVYETSYQNYKAIFRYNPDLVRHFHLKLNWNGSDVSDFGCVLNGTHAVCDAYYTIPLVQEDGIEVEWKIAGTIEKTFENKSYESPPEIQKINYAYTLDSVDFDSENQLEGNDFNAYLYYTDVLGKANINGEVNCFGNWQNMIKSNDVFYTELKAPQAETEKDTYNCEFRLNVSFNGQKRIMTQSKSLYVYMMKIYDSSEDNTMDALKITFWNEKTWDEENASISLIKFKIKNDGIEREYSFSETNESHQFDFYLYPSWASVSGNVYLEYENNQSFSRQYYANNVQLGNSQKEIKAYLLPTDSGAYTNIKVYDQNENPYANAYIRILKFNPNETAYETLFIGKTDENGVFPTFLEPLDQPYVFIVTDENGNIKLRTDDRVIPCFSTCPPYEVNLYIGGSEYSYVDFSGISYIFNYDNETRTLHFEISDDSGLVQSVRMQIYKVGDFGIKQLWKDMVWNSSNVITDVTLENDTREYQVQIYLKEFGEFWPFKTETITLEHVEAFGAYGILLSLITMITLEIIGMLSFGVAGASIGGIIGLFISYMLKWIPIPMLGVNAIIFVGIIVIWKVIE